MAFLKEAPKSLRPPAMLTHVDFTVFKKTAKEKAKVYNHKAKIKTQERQRIAKGESIKMQTLFKGAF